MHKRKVADQSDKGVYPTGERQAGKGLARVRAERAN